MITIFNLDITTLILFAFLLFSAGFVDAIGGGGGLLSVPGYLLTGLPIHTVFGTNKFAASVGTGVSFLQFLKHNKMHLGLLKYLAPMSFLGAILGVTTLQFVNPSFLKIIIPFLILVVGSYTLFNKSLGNESNYKHPKRNVLIKGMFFTLAIGFYDGFFGPGTGSFFVLAFVVILGFDFLLASAYAKVVNCITNISALLVFVNHGNYLLELAILMAVFNVLGNFLGTKIAFKKGNGFIRIVFLIIVMLMILRYSKEVFWT